MPSDEVFTKFQVGDPNIKPTDEKLKADAASLCDQYLHFWLPGEVEVTVILSRPDSLDHVYATSILSRERLRAMLKAVDEQSALPSLIVRGHRFQR